MNKSNNNNSIILDAYNANPSSMKEAISAFQKVHAKKKIYLLGDMLELGKQTTQEHQHIVSLLEKQSHRVILIGEEFGKIQHQFVHFNDTKEALSWIKNNPIKNHYILMKASRGIGLEKLKEIL